MPLVNPDPNYRDPNLEKMLLPEQGSVEGIDPFNSPIPGHSLTDNPGEAAWERPPIFSDPKKAFTFVMEKVEEKDTQQNFIKLMLAGTPIEAIVNTITFGGFSEGYWTPDVAEIIKLPLALHFIGVSMENNIRATVFNIDPESKRGQNHMPDEDMLRMMSERRPDMFNNVMYAADVIERTPTENITEEVPSDVIPEEQEESFLTAEEEF